MAATLPHLPPPQLTAPLADLHMLFTYLHHLSITHRRLRCQHPNCNRYSGRLHACIGCMFIGCFTSQHIHLHSQQCRHWCAVDVERGQVFCFHCRDYVYHKEIIQLQERASPPHSCTHHTNQWEELLCSFPYPPLLWCGVCLLCVG